MDSSDRAARARPKARAKGPVPAVAALAAVLLPAAVVATPVTGAPAPDFALKDLDGHNQRLSEFRGDVVVLTFWSSGCGPCRGALQSVNEIVGDGRTVALGVTFDRDASRAGSVAAALGLRFPSLVDAGAAVGRLYDVQQLPYTLVIDREGVVRAAWAREPVPSAVLLRTLEEIQQ
jgi:peroxiredoxin